MPTLTEMCRAIAPHSKMTVDELLKYAEGRNSMESSVRMGEIVATYNDVMSRGESRTRYPLNFKPSKGKRFIVT